ncbi:hypothetical protein GE09DRAFT_1146417 [Coniochaeta sp. 2T2.1]|nr:hypothetical protein GE09DRAFT_1146417 [Coniochaeta sp. 2T2.1]
MLLSQLPHVLCCFFVQAVDYARASSRNHNPSAESAVRNENPSHHLLLHIRCCAMGSPPSHQKCQRSCRRLRTATPPTHQ